MADEPTTLASIIRHPATLEPDDSVLRAVEILRYGGSDTIPVVDGLGALRGVVALSDLRPLIAQSAENDGNVLVAAVGELARTPRLVGSVLMPVSQVRQALAASGETALVILDDRGSYAGIVSLTDLLAPMPVRRRPAPIGGMATPWGVYLASGSLQGGVGAWALIGSGAMLGLLIAVSHAALGFTAWAVQRSSGIALYDLWNSPDPARVTAQNLGWFALHAATLPLFLALIRLMPLSKYHAAEHQAVHAMERGEPLHPAVVGRMPRVHPRCGTNLMAAGLIFIAVSQGMGTLGLRWLDATDAAALGAITTLFGWRRLGAWLQRSFTTSPAGDRHILSGIRAASELEEKYNAAPPVRPRFWQRIWAMGLVQTLIGVSIGSYASKFLSDALFQSLH